MEDLKLITYLLLIVPIYLALEFLSLLGVTLE